LTLYLVHMETPEEKSRPRGRPSGTLSPRSDAVRAVRKKMGWTQKQLAEKLPCSLSAVRYMEREGRLPGNLGILESFQKLARKAGVEL
jgi:ribosome-binding protein aMBF1 (putative translation factor)